ncbi:hypothetical protein GCM10023189_57290 [Nibrella saemangeumensis]|uniref:Rieske domain-containing protein n=1 Tax=Nibrella saemangeumensis TaxID=1084526 RepID=A0ABP8NRC4_9BACT
MVYVNFTLDLTSEDYKKLLTQGQFIRVGDVLVANAQGSSFVAVSRLCTHENGNLSYRLTQNDFLCDKHGGLFNINGSVKAAPPTRAVKAYNTSLSADGIKLTVTA